MVEIGGFELPDDLYYDPWESYLWARVEEENVRVGITSVGIGVAKDIAYMELPTEGDEVKQREAFGILETVKATAELLAPVSGTVVEVNVEMQENPASASEAPYEKWLMVIKASNLEEELKNLMDINQAKEWYAKEIDKLKADEIL